MHWATAWAPVNRLLIETGSTWGTLCKRYFDSGCRAFYSFYLEFPSVSMCRPPPSQDPLLFSVKYTARLHFIPLIAVREIGLVFFTCRESVTIMCDCAALFIYLKKKGKIIIVAALPNRQKKATMLLTQGAFKIIKGEQIVQHVCMLFLTFLFFLAGIWTILKRYLKNNNLLYSSSSSRQEDHCHWRAVEH